VTAARTRLEPSVRRELILDAAERVLADRMPSEVTFEEIADAAGVSRGLVYNYFRDRTALMVALTTRALADLDDRIDRAFEPGSDRRSQVVALGRAYRRHAATHAATWRLLSRSGLLDHPTIQGSRSARVERIAAHWGGDAHAHLVAWSITGLYELAGVSPMPRGASQDDLTRFVTDVIVPDLAPPSPSRSPGTDRT